MFTQIISNTPAWVWMLLAGFIALGYSQTKDRTVSFKRLVLLPLAMLILSAHSMMQNFGLASIAFLLWSILVVVVSKRVAEAPKLLANSHYDANQDRVFVTGSWWPMLCIVAIFIGQYVVAILAHIKPELFNHTYFMVASALYFGSLSGFFAGRAKAFLAVRRASTQKLSLSLA